MTPLPRMLFHCACLSGCIFIACCGDDPEQVKKREEQKKEIARLEGEVALLSEKLGAMPADRSKELAEIKEQTKQKKSELEQLTGEVEALEAKKRETSSAYDAYKKKYPVNR
jgi:septal ring factor EnvC (AmiA/AmiB activator)